MELKFYVARASDFSHTEDREMGLADKLELIKMDGYIVHFRFSFLKINLSKNYYCSDVRQTNIIQVVYGVILAAVIHGMAKILFKLVNVDYTKN